MTTLSRNFLPLVVFAAILLAPRAGQAQDAAAPTTESRLRDALRNTMLQLRDAQGQVAVLQASQAQSDKDNADLKAKIDAFTAQVSSLTKQSADDKMASDKAIADLKSQNVDLTTQVAKLNDALAAWEKDDQQFRQLAQGKETARAQLAGQVILLQRLVDDRETKNLALFNLGNEILTRYEKFSLGDALAAQEPFTGISRVKLEELVQDYQDKISDQRVTPGQMPPASPAALNPSRAAPGAAPEKKANTAAQPAGVAAQ
jgi:chromosome segregation ATPase